MKRKLFSIILLIIANFCFGQDAKSGITTMAGAGGGVATYWYMDFDGDGFGEKGLEYQPIKSVNQPEGYVDNNVDLDDNDRYITNIPPIMYYLDQDRDTFGSTQGRLYSVRPSIYYVTNNTDCNDNDGTINPNTKWYRDGDGDTYGNPAIVLTQCLQRPGYVRNASDSDDFTGNIINIAPQYFYQDRDGDSFGNPSVAVYYSYMPAGYVTNNLDCNDGRGEINPNTYWYRDGDGDTFGSGEIYVKTCVQPEGYVLNYEDQDDGTANITNIPPRYYSRDFDRDGFGDPLNTVYYSIAPAGYIDNALDCNDFDATVNPNKIWYRDVDGDGYGVASVTTQSCQKPDGYVDNASDYDDSTGNITNIAPRYFYRDYDTDTFGDPANYVYYSNMPTGYVANNLDCNDFNIMLNPETKWYRDFDKDGFGDNNVVLLSCLQPDGYVGNNADCNDAVNLLNPNSVWYRDTDGDGFGSVSETIIGCTQPIGYVANAADYDDSTGNITNIAPQTFYRDVDKDGFGDPASSVFYSKIPDGYVTNNLDCHDGDNTLNPDTKWYADNDSDGLGDPSNYVQQCTMPAGKYVRNNTDNCPLISGSSSDCNNIIAPSDQNYVISKIYKEPTDAVLESPSLEQAQTSITYFDGLGRPVQKIANRQSTAGKDIVTHIGYDNLGRDFQDYLPYESSSANMAFETNAKDNTLAFYNVDKYGNTSNPYSQKELESSPLNRVLKQAAPGNPWGMGSGHEIKMEYQSNLTADAVKMYQAAALWNEGSGLYDISISEDGTYGENALYKSITYDENTVPGSNAGTEEFKNKEGQIVLKRTYNAGDRHDTYYVYDIYGNLTYVIPPKAEGAIDFDVLNGLCYQYKYDSKNRLVEKKLPGKQWEFIVYDKLDRPVATGPAYSPFKDESALGWIITKYDAFNRPIYTGWSSQTSNAATRKSLQDAQNAATVLFETKQASGTIDGIEAYYSNVIAPTSFKLLTVNYYDDYVFPNAQTLPASVEGQPILANVKGMASGSWTRAVTTSSSTAGETSTIFYDDKARPVKNYLQNYLGGYASSESKLDFTGKTLYTVTKHKRTSGNPEIAVREEFSYSPQDRLLTHTHQVNGGIVELLADNTYDALGQLISKKTGSSVGSPLQKVDYQYNIRGWLKEINKTGNLQQDTDPLDLFAFKINYETAQTDISDVKALYNGNISETFWKTASDLNERAYGYKYDNLNRLTNAVYEKNGLTTSAYDENLSYDKNGNIIKLIRKGDYDPQVGNLDIDDLVYTYTTNSNQLSKVEDNSNNTSGFNDANKIGDDYSYDDNGNMITDKNKNITSITYNHLNLPKKITFGTTGSIEYFYNASGQKLKKAVTEGTVTVVTDYLGGYQYKDNVLEFFPTAEGYVKNTAGALSYVFQYKDHLGNVRISYAKNPTTQVLEIIEENNYYPFGLKHKAYNDYLPTANKYKYNGKELQDEMGLGVYFFKFRSYDPALGRFWQIDPLAGTYAHNSTYAFAENNVSSGTDLEGLELSFHLNGNLATAQSGPRVTGGVNGNYTLQELKSHMAQKQANEDRAMGKLMSGDPRSIPSGEIRPAKGDINTARFDDPGMMMADGARIGAEFMAMEAGGALAVRGASAFFKGESVWAMNALQRGRRIEEMLGANPLWPKNFPTIDKVVDGVATSIKSMDLTAKSYQKGNAVLNTLKGYVDDLAKFTSETWGGTAVTKGETYTSKALELAVQTGKGSEGQWNQINQAIEYALKKDINVTIKFIK